MLFFTFRRDYDELYQLDCDHQDVEEDADYSGVVGLVHAHTSTTDLPKMKHAALYQKFSSDSGI